MGVDAIALTLCLWGVSGLFMWWQIKATRKPGLAVLAVSQCIAKVTTRATTWITNGEIPVNNGLAAIIGSRGSGKSVLPDILAIDSNAVSPLELATSFTHRASNPTNHIGDAIIDTHWGDGAQNNRWMNKTNPNSGPDLGVAGDEWPERPRVLFSARVDRDIVLLLEVGTADAILSVVGSCRDFSLKARIREKGLARRCREIYFTRSDIPIFWNV